MIYNVLHNKIGVTFGQSDSKGGIKPKFANCSDKWVVGMSRTTGSIMTGLTKEQERSFEEKFSMNEGELSRNSDYWSNYFIIIPEDGLRLNTEVDEDLFKYILLKNDPRIVEGEEELLKSPRAEYYIVSEENTAKTHNLKRNVVAKAYAKFAKMSQAEIVDALFMYGKGAVNLDPEVAQNRLGELLDEDPSKFNDIVGDPLFKDKVFIHKLIRSGIVKKHGTGKGNNMPLYFQDIMLGSNVDEAVAFVKAKENSAILIGLNKLLHDDPTVS